MHAALQPLGPFDPLVRVHRAAPPNHNAGPVTGVDAVEVVGDALAQHWGLHGRPLTECTPGSLSRAWLVAGLDHAEPAGVAKLARNTLEHFDVGLRVSEIINAAGITSGVPILTQRGERAVAMTVGDAPHSLAVLTFVRGTPPTDRLFFGPAELGRLLGRVHASLAGVELSGGWTTEDVIEHTEGGILPNHPGWVAAFVHPALAAVKRWMVDATPRCQLLRGDGPEILVDGGHFAGLIDWGATRWGSVSDDIGCWTVHYGRFYDTYRSFTETFVAAYRDEAPLTAEEEDAIPLFQAFRLASRPTYMQDESTLADMKRWVDTWRRQAS
jgi:Ser/Thr protein kinase RdoA (MazF antagonist)